MTIWNTSMSKWLNKWTCTGFMVVPRKTWLCGNEFHKICCSGLRVLFGPELAEGKDKPPQAPRKDHHFKGKTVLLCLHLTKAPYGTWSLVVMGSYFCVLQSLAELRSIRVFRSARIKKWLYCPIYVKGDGTKAHCNEKNPGYYDAISGELQNQNFYIYRMQEPNYVLLFMDTYSFESQIGRDQVRASNDGTNIRNLQFKHPEVFHNHY